MNFIRAHGIRGDTSLYQKFGVLEFLAFVWLQEAQAGRQFGVYVDLAKDDPVTAQMLEAVKEDEGEPIVASPLQAFPDVLFQ